MNLNIYQEKVKERPQDFADAYIKKVALKIKEITLEKNLSGFNIKKVEMLVKLESLLSRRGKLLTDSYIDFSISAENNSITQYTLKTNNSQIEIYWITDKGLFVKEKQKESKFKNYLSVVSFLNPPSEEPAE